MNQQQNNFECSALIAGHVTVIFNTEENESVAFNAAVDMSQEERDGWLAEEWAEMKKIDPDLVELMKEDTDARAAIYMRIIRNAVSLGKQNFSEKLPELAMSIIAALGEGNYVFDTTGCFVFPIVLSDDQRDMFITHLKLEQKVKIQDNVLTFFGSR